MCIIYNNIFAAFLLTLVLALFSLMRTRTLTQTMETGSNFDLFVDVRVKISPQRLTQNVVLYPGARISMFRNLNVAKSAKEVARLRSLWLRMGFAVEKKPRVA